MRALYSLVVICLLVSAASGQMIDNPFIHGAPKATAKPPSSPPAIAPRIDPTLEQIKAKENYEQALNELYQLEYNVAERGRIWAKTNDDWTDIRIVEAALNKALKHHSTAEDYWDAGRYDDWLREMGQVHDAMHRALPQLDRTDRMIRAYGGSSPVRGGIKSSRSAVNTRTESKKRTAP